MKPVPDTWQGKQARMMDALVGDILDRDAKGFDRLNALKAVVDPDEPVGWNSHEFTAGIVTVDSNGTARIVL